jgi:hypothetical protein
VNKSINIVLGDRFGNAFCSPDVNVIEIEVPKISFNLMIWTRSRENSLCWIISADEIVDDIGMPYALLDRCFVPEIHFLRRSQ